MVSYLCIADSVCSHPLYLTIFNPTSPLSIFPDLLLCDSLLIFTWTEYYMAFGLELSVGTLWLFHWCIDMTVTVSLRIHQWPTVHHRRKVIIKPSPSRDWVLTGAMPAVGTCCEICVCNGSIMLSRLLYAPFFPPSSSYLVFSEPSRGEIEMSCFGLSIKPSLFSYPEQPRVCSNPFTAKTSFSD